ncbi:hypothetical protein M9Y10_022625 [Tritrichomonas musculus]|uniref:Uncharacterized protein n=1 Tax=Tritrichomonas musculus TaxID=1915356 RepID=A0ABR2KTD0_9EUKA
MNQMEDIYTDSDRSHSTFSVRTSFGETYPSMFDDSDFKDINANKLKNVLRELIDKCDHGEVRKFIRRNKE